MEKRRLIKWHLQNECLEKLLDCTNDDCKLQIKKKNLDNHIKNKCPERSVECEYKKYGCNIKNIKAKQLKKHMEINKDVHLSIITQTV